MASSWPHNTHRPSCWRWMAKVRYYIFPSNFGQMAMANIPTFWLCFLLSVILLYNVLLVGTESSPNRMQPPYVSRGRWACLVTTTHSFEFTPLMSILAQSD